MQTLGELRIVCGTTNWWAGLWVCIYSRRVLHGVATVVDSIRVSIHALRCEFLCLESKQTRSRCCKPVLISMLAFSLVFHKVTPECSKNHPNIFPPIPDAEYVVLFVEWLMAREVRCRGTDWQTHRHNNYRNPRCVCVPRVNNNCVHPNLLALGL